MSTTAADGPTTPGPAEVAAALREAPFVSVLARADGDCLAASGLVVRGLRAVDVPFQVRTTPHPPRADPPDESVVLAVGHDVVDGDDAVRTLSFPADGRPRTVAAFETARELGVDPDPALGLAGIVAAERTPGAVGADVLDAAERRGAVERRPGVAVPTADLAAGLAWTTLFHAPVSGDEEAARELLTTLGIGGDGDVADADITDVTDEDHRRLASVVAIDATTADGATPRAAEKIERALRPYATPTEPFETVGGYADVLDAVAVEAPGLGVALALGNDVADAALETWRRHAARVHDAVETATTSRYDGCYVARVAAGEGVRPAAARLIRDFRSPEPVVLVVGDDGAAAAGVDTELAEATASAADSVEGRAWGHHRGAQARFESDDADAFVEAFREALA